MQALIIHTTSLYYWWPNYESHLDDRIHAALDAGLDGIEISNGPSILTWQPDKETIERLKGKVVTIHAEVGESFGVSLEALVKALTRLPFEIANVVFHPDELGAYELSQLGKLPFPVSLENMDSCNGDYKTVSEVKRVMAPGVGFTYDTAHAEENGLNTTHFTRALQPIETHLSLFNNEDYYGLWGYSTRHSLTHFAPDRFPEVPRGCPIVTIEGLVPPDMDILKDEVKFVRGQLDNG